MKIKFVGVDGTPGASPAQGTCLLAIGERGCEALERAAARGLGVGCTFDTDAASPGQHITPWIKARTFITRNSLDV